MKRHHKVRDKLLQFTPALAHQILKRIPVVKHVAEPVSKAIHKMVEKHQEKVQDKIGDSMDIANMNRMQIEKADYMKVYSE